MRSLLIQNWVHLVAAVVLAGYALFWLVMALALRNAGGDLNAGDMLSLVGRSRWPPAGPKALRVPIVGLGWLLVLFMAASGLLLLRTRGIGAGQLASGEFWAGRIGLVVASKAVLLVLFAATHARLSSRPTASAAVICATLVGMILCASALL